MRTTRSRIVTVGGTVAGEVARDATPCGVRHLLGRAIRDVDVVRNELRAYVTEHLGNQDVTLVIDDIVGPEHRHCASDGQRYENGSRASARVGDRPSIGETSALTCRGPRPYHAVCISLRVFRSLAVVARSSPSSERVIS